MNINSKKYLCFVVAIFSWIAAASELSPNGYSGLGIVPNASSISGGSSIVAFDRTLPGALSTKGYNTQVGLGLYEGMELVGRLATNDLKCNMFNAYECPKNNIRDFSASLKWSLQNDWLKHNKAQVAFGVTDVGGAASYFKSYYAVASKELGSFEISIGQAKSVAENALLKGTFGAVNYKPTGWLDLNVQRVGSSSWAVAALKSEIPYTQASGYLTLNQRISDDKATEKNWVGVGVSIPLDSTKSRKLSGKDGATLEKIENKQLATLNPEDLRAELKAKGFFNPSVTLDKNLLKIEVENTAYAWNTVDAIGSALGVLASTYGNSDQQIFELTLTSRGISQVVVEGDAQCVRRWLEAGEVCSNLAIRSGLQRSFANGHSNGNYEIQKFDISSWTLRPELILSPIVFSSIGTEYGAFDFDGGININSVLPLWKGATIESNQVKSLGVGTRGFEQGGVFYSSRIQQVVNRKLIHQLINISSLNTQARISKGTAYATWDGYQVETSTQSDSGRHRIGLVTGNFKNDAAAYNNQKTYELVTYRYAHDDIMSTVTELTQGKFWAGDRGWSIGQKFWHGDTALNVYLRRTQMTGSSPLVSFAGLQISIPITPRINKGMENLAVRGTNQWTYTLESRVFDKTNLLTGGYGEIPRIGDSLVQTFNRDRNSTRYLESSLIRAKSAFNELSTQ